MTQNPKKTKKKLSKQQIIGIVCSCFLVLAHVAVLLAIILSFRYYSIYPTLFGSIVAIVVCLMIIVDIIYFVGFNHRDKALKIVSCVLAFLLLLGGTVGSYAVARVNGVVNNVLGSNKTEKYETFSGVIACYDKYNTFTSLTDLNNKRIGTIAETSKGIKYIATKALDEAKVKYENVDYKTNTELLQALLDGQVDAVVITSTYKEIFSSERDENSPFARYLDNFIDFYSFQEDLKVESNKTQKNLNKDPFNVLLIGYSRTDIGSTVGLADSIILATINPQTYTVSMMSIARDSFVPIACYGGEYDKINSGRSTSRACFIETVEDFIGMDVDYYMELDYLGLVQIVNTIGGVKINNPVDFELDGIYVPAGQYKADGQQALQFCRERHHMPNGDFDRQQHQKEVIIEIAKTFIRSGDVALALDAMDAASDWMSTDFTLNELTTLFNLLLNTKNYTSLDTFDLVDFQTLRITGSGGIMYYSYSMRLPLWVYLIYQGSYDESMQHVNDVMGNYSTYSQLNSFEFSCQKPYERAPFYSLDYEDKFLFTPEKMPPYMIDLYGYSLDEAVDWCKENKIEVTGVDYIKAGTEGYNEELEGLVVDQSARYGDLLSDVKSTTLTVMGTGEVDSSLLVPDMHGWDIEDVDKWANKHDVDYEIVGDAEEGIVIHQDGCKKKSLISACDLLEVELSDEASSIDIYYDYEDVEDEEYIETKRGLDGDKLTLKATKVDGYIFDHWVDSNGKNFGKNKDRIEITLVDGTEYTAVYKVDPNAEPVVPVEPEDPVVPVEPEDPVVPVEPDTPTKPDKPEEDEHGTTDDDDIEGEGEGGEEIDPQSEADKPPEEVVEEKPPGEPVIE